jgi:hypothetical protein
MRDIAQWIVALALLCLVVTAYFKSRATTSLSADGACQSLTVEDECY